jgi:hypothetical protein
MYGVLDHVDVWRIGVEPGYELLSDPVITSLPEQSRR